MAILRVTSGPGAGTEIPLNSDAVIGREGTDVVLDDPEISRRHLAVRPRPDGVEVEDLGSRNGTFRDGRRLEGPTLIRPGGRIEVGSCVLEVGIEDADATLVRQRASETVSTRRMEPDAPPHSAPVVTEPFGAFRAAPTRRTRGSAVASRAIGPAAATFATIGGTAIALIAYFAQR